MQFIDLIAQYKIIQDKVNHRIQSVLEHGQYILGPEVTEVENRLAEFVGVSNCVATGNGSDAITLSLLALGIGAGDEIIMPSFSFFATAEMPALMGATPVFVDINPETYNIEESLIEAAITSKTKAIMPVSLYGLCPDMGKIERIAEKHNLALVEDGAQSFGATVNKRRSCSFGAIGVTSFFPAKPLGCYGDGGACFTNDDDLANKLRQLRNHGQEGRYHHTRLGLNSRMDSLQAAILLEKLAIFPQEIKQREEVASIYQKAFEGKISFQKNPSGHSNVYAQFTIEVEDRQGFVAQMSQKTIPTSVHYPSLLQEQPALSYLEVDGEATPIARKISRRCVSLPMHPYLSKSDQDRIIAATLETLNL